MSAFARLSPSEVVGLLFALGGAVFALVERRRLRANGDAALPLAAFGALLAGWTITLAEGFVWPRGLNFVEHLCYAAGTTLLAVWCWRRILSRRREG